MTRSQRVQFAYILLNIIVLCRASIVPKSIAAASNIAAVAVHWVQPLNASHLFLESPQPCAYIGHLANYWCALVLPPVLQLGASTIRPALQHAVCCS